MNKGLVFPSLADINWTPNIFFPKELLLKWENSIKSIESHQVILHDYFIEGTLVCSDSCGFARLTQKRHLIEVVYLIHQPKEIICAYGKAIGGIPIGQWDADNTCMFYPPEINMTDIIKQMACAHKKIQEKCEVQVSIGIMRGKFLSINEIFMGEEFNIINEVTENKLDSLELAVINPEEEVVDLIKRTFRTEDYTIADNSILKILYEQNDYLCLSASDSDYPKPFSMEFLKKISRKDSINKADLDNVFKDFSLETNVCFLKVLLNEEAYLLDRMVKVTLLNALFDETAQSYNITVVKHSDGLYIIFCQEINELIQFLVTYCDILKQATIKYSCGVAHGSIIKETDSGNKITYFDGNPVNIASKLSEDVGVPGYLRVHESVKDKISTEWNISRFEESISSITLKGSQFLL